MGHTEQEFVPPKIAAVLEQLDKPYYDEVADQKARQTYYAELDLQAGPDGLFEQLNSLMRRTHRKTLAFKPLKYLHPWVDLRPNLRLQGVYNDQARPTNDPVKHNKTDDFIVRVRVREPGHERADGTRPMRWGKKKIDFRSQEATWLETLHQGPLDAVTIAEANRLSGGQTLLQRRACCASILFWQPS